jgi:CubicO group peptidase (beta-lactamase class C family)
MSTLCPALAASIFLLIQACAARQQAVDHASGNTGASSAPVRARPVRHAEAVNGVMVAADPRRAQRFAALVPQLDRLFAQSVVDDHVAGLAVGIVLDGKAIYVKGFGVQNRDTGAPFGTRSVFRIASVTKSITAMAILKLRDEGKLRLDDPAVLYWPALAELTYPTRDSAEITVRQLLTHGSGLPEDNNWVDAAGTVSDEQFEQMLHAGMRFSRAPDTSYEV